MISTIDEEMRASQINRVGPAAAAAAAAAAGGDVPYATIAAKRTRRDFPYILYVSAREGETQ